MDENSSIKQKILFLYKTSGGLVLFAFFILIIFFLVMITFLTTHKNASPIARNPQNTNTEANIIPAPKIDIKTYANQATLPVVPTSATVYSLKNNLNEVDVQSFAQKVGLTAKNTKGNNDYVVFSNFSEPAKIGFGMLNKNSGAFSLQFFGQQKPLGYQTGMSAQSEALLYLNQLGFSDNTISCPITYQRKDTQARQVTYVECHRDWQKVGLSILSPVGILNSDPSQPLNTLKEGEVDAQTPNNANIINVSNGAIGKERPTDFNTATIGIKPDGTIVSADSNLREIIGTNSVPINLTPKQALAAFINHKNIFSISVPIGSGPVDMDKIYSNHPQTDLGIISDIVLTYLELPSSSGQKTLTPFYLARGYATLTNGYQVSFIHLLPAVGNALALNNNRVQDVAGVSTNSLQIKSFTPTPSPNMPTITSSPINKNQPAPTSAACVNTDAAASQYSNGAYSTISIPGLGDMQVYHTNNGSQPDGSQFGSHTYFFVSASFPTQDMKDIQNAFYKAVANQYVINVAKWAKGKLDLPNKTNSNIRCNNTLVNLSSSNIENFYSSVNEQCRYTVSVSGRNYTSTTVQPPTGVSSVAHPAPYNYTSSEAGKEIETSVTQQLTTILANNQLDMWANMSDIFPDETNDGAFDWIFDYVPDQFGIGVRNEITACYISGTSPSLFFYPPSKQQISVNLPPLTTYASPGTENNSWEFMVNSNGLLQTADLTFDHAYYEYNATKLLVTIPQEGYVTSFDKWQSVVKKIGKALELNQNEEKQLENEVQYALYNQPKSSYLKISLANENELNKKLPLTISPQPNIIRRVQLLLTPTDQKIQSTEPNFQPIIRNGFTVVEVGARIE